MRKREIMEIFVYTFDTKQNWNLIICNLNRILIVWIQFKVVVKKLTHNWVKFGLYVWKIERKCYRKLLEGEKNCRQQPPRLFHESFIYHYIIHTIDSFVRHLSIYFRHNKSANFKIFPRARFHFFFKINTFIQKFLYTTLNLYCMYKQFVSLGWMTSHVCSVYPSLGRMSFYE